MEVTSYSPVGSPETIEILDESIENESEDVENESEHVENESEHVAMISTSTEVIDESRFSSVHLQSESDTEMPESSSNLEEQA